MFFFLVYQLKKNAKKKNFSKIYQMFRDLLSSFRNTTGYGIFNSFVVIIHFLRTRFVIYEFLFFPIGYKKIRREPKISKKFPKVL